MGLDLKSLFKKKSGNQAVDVSQVKTGTQTTDNLISEAVANAGNISSMTLSKKEQAALMEERKKVPMSTIVLKFFSLTMLAISIVLALVLTADLDPGNQYLGLLSSGDNTGAKYVKQAQEKNSLEKSVAELNKTISSLTERSERFEKTPDTKKVGLLIPEIAEIETLQRRWFNEEVVVIENEGTEDETKFKELKYGLIDSFDNMIDYFEDSDYQPRFFNEKRRNESLSSSEPEICRTPSIQLDESDKALKRQYQNAGRCLVQSKLIMANNVDIRGLNINSNSANVTVTVSDLLSRVFTLSSEFVAMMNSYPFYKGAEMTSFSRRDVAEGGDSTEIALRLEYQAEDEEDPYDQYLKDLQEWQAEKGLNIGS